MTRTEAIKTLKHYQRWRMGSDDDTPMLDPKEISKAINFAIKELEKIKLTEPEQHTVVGC